MEFHFFFKFLFICVCNVHDFVYVVWVISHTHCYKDSNESRTFLYKCVACVSLSKQKLLELFQFKRKQFLFRLLYTIASYKNLFPVHAFSLTALSIFVVFSFSLDPSIFSLNHIIKIEICVKACRFAIQFAHIKFTSTFSKTIYIGLVAWLTHTFCTFSQQPNQMWMQRKITWKKWNNTRTSKSKSSKKLSLFPQI